MSDVHLIKVILSIDDRITVRLTVDTDVILGPDSLLPLGSPKQSCVIFEYKTHDAVQRGRGMETCSEATLDLISANYKSNQMTTAVMTDMNRSTSILTLSIFETNVHITQYNDVSLNQMVTCISNHIKDSCVPDNTHMMLLEHSDKASDVALKLYNQRVRSIED